MQDWAELREGVLEHLQDLQRSLPDAYSKRDVPLALGLARDLEGAVMAIGLEEAAAVAADLPPMLARSDTNVADIHALLARIRRSVAAATPPAMELPTLGTRVLVVEDVPVTRRVLRHILERAGCDVLEAATNKEAFATLQKDRPQAILLDIHLPDGDGTLVCSSLRRDPKSRLLPVIVLTGDGDAEALRVAYDAGADDFLVKPVRAGDLVMRLGLLLRQAGLRRNRGIAPRIET